MRKLFYLLATNQTESHFNLDHACDRIIWTVKLWWVKFWRVQIDSPNSPMFSTANVSHYTVISCFLTFCSSERLILTHFLNFKFLVCLLFIAHLHSVCIAHNINQSVLLSLLSKCQLSYRRLLNYVLQPLVNKNANMVKQLYYSKIHSKNIEIFLSKLYGTAQFKIYTRVWVHVCTDTFCTCKSL